MKTSPPDFKYYQEYCVHGNGWDLTANKYYPNAWANRPHEVFLLFSTLPLHIWYAAIKGEKGSFQTQHASYETAVTPDSQSWQAWQSLDLLKKYLESPMAKYRGRRNLWEDYTMALNAELFEDDDGNKLSW